MGEVFPADDPVARWLVTISVGLNDVVHANRLMDAAEEGYETAYFFRLASLHLWELTKFIEESHAAWDEIQAFVATLPEKARREHFRAIEEMGETGALASVGKELVQIRDLFVHYQEMDTQERKKPRDPITKAMEGIVDETIELEIGEEVCELRLGYADEVIGKTILRLIPDEESQVRVIGMLGEGVGHVTQFVQMALNAWLEPREEKLERVK